ncbi:hypothetical protein S7335_933 [Synechococcus sp. PCC 7335]|uniref:hypothetical protein n=1 Tax=Synechococcus sp. (strain ATCC 29403 / PCC 7335) TaxID=91464 RepID=UPI00017EC81C|nr:hypothetical protein [Synechococcus sp. PCC 7335]EDX82632.1 hypothetical protein S7335_933 [Synechococcus sp. PCC 7335]
MDPTALQMVTTYAMTIGARVGRLTEQGLVVIFQNQEMLDLFTQMLEDPSNELVNIPQANLTVISRTDSQITVVVSILG